MGGVIISGGDTIAVGDTVVGVTVTGDDNVLSAVSVAGGDTVVGGVTIIGGDTVVAGVTVTGGDATTVVALLNPKSVEVDGEKYFHISVHCDRFKPRSRVRLKSCPVARG